MNSKSKTIIGAIVALGCYYLPIILSGVIYVTLICSKRKMLKNKIEALDDGMIISENQVQGNVTSDHQFRKTINSIPKNKVTLLKAAHSQHNAEIAIVNQEVEIQNGHHDCDDNQLLKEVTENDTSQNKAENNLVISNANSVENIPQVQLDNEINLPVVLNCLSHERSNNNNNKSFYSPQHFSYKTQNFYKNNF
jgi:hypothetical protein